MIDEQQPRCGNPACGLPIVVLHGHRQYCNDACRMAAHRARIVTQNEARY